MGKQLTIKQRRTLDEIIGDNLDSLVRFARFRTGSIEDAEDIVHDAIVRLIDKDVASIKKEMLKSYVFRIVYNLCIDYQRRMVSYVPLDGIREAFQYEAAEVAEEVGRVNSMLGKLPVREAEVIRMNVVDGLSFVDISHILNVPVSTLKSRYKAGMERLRPLLSGLE